MKEETRYGKHNQPKEWYQRKLVEYLKAKNPESPVELGLCSKNELDALVASFIKE